MVGRSTSVASSTGVKPKDVANVTRLLSTLLIAGVTLPEGLNALVEQVESPRFKGILSDLGAKVNEGSSLADAMQSHSDVFDKLYVNMVRAGEASGSLETVLIRIADFMEQQEELRSKVSTALVYPVVMSIVGAFVVGILMVKVVPQISQMFEDQGAELPWTTRMLMWISNTLVDYWLPLIILAGLELLGLDGLEKIRVRASDPRSGGSQGTARGGPGPEDRGFPFRADALDHARERCSAARGARHRTRTAKQRGAGEGRHRTRAPPSARGESVAAALKRSGQFPALVTHMIAVGERSGQLEKMLTDVADAYDREASTAISRSTAVLEPVMIVVMAGVVGFIVFSIMTPILQMNQMVGQ